MTSVTAHHTAQVNGTRLHYVTAGEGPPVMLLHGWPQTWYEWRHVIDLLEQRGTPGFSAISERLYGGAGDGSAGVHRFYGGVVFELPGERARGAEVGRCGERAAQGQHRDDEGGLDE